MDTRGPNIQLSGRQREVLDLIGRGHTNGEIAAQLGLSFATAKWYVSELISIYGVDSREDLIDEWRAERGLRRRVARLARVVAAGATAKVAAASLAVGAAMACVFGVLVVAGSSGSAGTDAGSPTPAPTATPVAAPPPGTTSLPTRNIIAVSPDDGAKAASTLLDGRQVDRPRGVCVQISNEGLATNLRAFRLAIDQRDVTDQLAIFASNDGTAATLCADGGALSTGTHTAEVTVQDDPAGPPSQRYGWSFEVTR